MNKLKYTIIYFSLIIVFTGCKDKTTLFSQLPVNYTHLNFNNTIIENESFNINQYLYAHNGAGVSVGDFNNDGLSDIFFTANQLSNKLYINQGDFKFKDVTEEAGVSGLVGSEYWTTGSTVVDINQDGWLDIYVNQVANLKNLKGRNQLFVNNGDGTFTDKAKTYGLALKTYAQQAVFFDFDLDGDLDMYQLNHSVHELDVYGKSDKRLIRDSLAGDRLYRNDNFKFNDVSENAGIYGSAMGYGLSVSVSDLDNNGYPDIYVSNDFHENDYVYYNNGNGTFKEAAEETMGHTSTFSMGSDAADLNNDGLIDIMTLDMKPEDEVLRKSSAGADTYEIYNYKRSFGYSYQYPRNMLQLNRGQLFDSKTQFSEVGQLAGVDATDWSWSVLLADFDNDGLKDIYITNGILRRPNDLDYINFTYNTEVVNNKSTLELAYLMPDGKASNYAYKNLGQLAFKNVSQSWGLSLKGCSNGAAYADFDNDGDLDLVVNNLNELCTIYKNNSEATTTNNYLKVALEGNKKNRNGIGTRVEIQIGAQTIVQELNPARGWISSSDFTLNFGLGQAKIIDTIKVKWYDGKEQVLTNIQPNKLLKLKYNKAKNPLTKNIKNNKLFKTVKDSVLSNFKHKENPFVDFNNEQLMPHKLSTEGPKITVADINNDGLEDFFVGGAKGQASEIFFQRNIKGVYLFEKQVIKALELDKDKEDTDAIFFDADSDGDQDLYVVSGGAQSKKGKSNQDRLYFNLGDGTFEKSEQLPKIEDNGSCVVAADFNGNGFKDLFIGSRSVYSKYGVSPDSYLLWNDGYGKFSIDVSEYSKALKALGMVTDAVWNFKNKELIVVGEWMPISFLKFKTNRIEKKELKKSSGWWNTIYASDIDNDGDTDYLIGNAGENSDLKTSENNPIQLIIKDWDQNGTIDPLIAYNKHGKSWLFNGLDELKKQMPQIRNRYNSYALFAGHTLNNVFSETDLNSAEIKKAEIFSSAILLNDNDIFTTIQPLPTEVQLAPVYGFLTKDFNKDGFMDILAVGNFYGNTPAIGRYDASYGSFLSGNTKGDFSYIEPRFSGFSIQGESRDIKALKVGNENWILVTRNDGGIKIFK
tara:strand:- start:46200 stop:49472 length:3273 start_codon:yes stop_codon:yes gene_type:complete